MNEVCVPISEHISSLLPPNFEVKPFDDEYVVITPSLHFDGSCIEIYVESSDEQFLLSDAGETLHMLFVHGITVEEDAERMKLADNIAQRNGVSFEDSAIFARATEETFEHVMHNLVQVIQEIGRFIR